MSDIVENLNTFIARMSALLSRVIPPSDTEADSETATLVPFTLNEDGTVERIVLKERARPDKPGREYCFLEGSIAGQGDVRSLKSSSEHPFRGPVAMEQSSFGNHVVVPLTALCRSYGLPTSVAVLSEDDQLTTGNDTESDRIIAGDLATLTAAIALPGNMATAEVTAFLESFAFGQQNRSSFFKEVAKRTERMPLQTAAKASQSPPGYMLGLMEFAAVEYPKSTQRQLD